LFDKVHAVHPHVAIVGRSLGTGVAIRLASERPASRLILITPYNSLVELAQSRMPLFPVKWVMRDTFESWRYAPLITVPTLLIAAGQDEIIPRASTEQLHAHFAKGVATLQVIPGKDHNSISDSPQYLHMLRDGL